MEEDSFPLISRRDGKNSKVLVLIFNHAGLFGVGVTEDQLGEFLCCPPPGFFWDEVLLEAFFSRLGFTRWNCGGGLIVSAATVYAFVFCSAAVF